MALNVITAKFCSGATQTWASDAWQYDYGQVLQFDGVDLPEAYQVHFSNEPMTGETITQIGNADGVSVPDQFFRNGEPIFAWVYLHEGEDDGETVYMVTIPVKKRPQPSDEVPTPEEQSAIDQAIAALNIAVEKADEAITHYPQIIDGTWHVWDVTTEAYVDTGVQAQGPQGVKGDKGDNGTSPTITVTDITDGHRVTITDADGTKTFDVMNGAQGDPGAKGDPGADGVSPTVTVTEITGGHRVVITDASGEHTFDVMDGQGGGGTITVDSALSPTSENPVQNKVINAALGDLMEDLNQLGEDKADIIISSAEGTVASFSDGAEYDAVSLIAHFEPYQEGTGDQSPDNVRPIHGWTGFNILTSGEDTTNPTTIPISWQTEAGEVYGGYVDATNGEVWKTWTDLDLGTVNFGRVENASKNYWYFQATGNVLVNGKPYPGTGELSTMVCPIYKTTTAYNIGIKGNEYPFCIGVYNGRGLRLTDSRYETAADLKAALSGIYVYYELETPVLVGNIDPTAIELLKGYNNVWNSAGGNNEVEYRADMKLYIDGKQLDIRNTIAPIEDGDTASQAYAVGRYFYRNGAFCKAKTAIASGAAFTLNTNYEVTTVANELYTALH